MRKRLSKIVRDLQTNIGLLGEFLIANGYDFNEDPNEDYPSDVVEFIEENYPAFLARKNGQRRAYKTDHKPQESANREVPLELRIIEAAGKEKKLIERIIGFTDMDWPYTVAKYSGTCSQPIEFSLFDEVICDLLLLQNMPTDQIGEILGLDTIKDPAERDILDKALHELENDKIVEGDGHKIWLTELGKEYVNNGVKFSTFTRNFDLYIDNLGPNHAKTKEIFRNLKSEKNLTHDKELLPKTIEEVKPLAEVQAPEIHFPQKSFLLQSSRLTGAQGFKAKVWIVLLENFRDNTMRAIVYDEKQDKIIDTLSEVLDRNEKIKAELLEKIVDLGEYAEFTQETKQQEQIDAEEKLIHKQVEIDLATDNHDAAKLKEIAKEIESIRSHFYSLEFEIELKRLFDTTSDSIMIQSPWVRDFAFKKRIPFIREYLKKGGRVYISYSANESFNGDKMVQDESMKLLLDLDKNLNFYYCELPAFHYKNVWLVREDKKNIYYSGSYNILSFFVSQNMKKIRQEKMTRMEWDSELEKQYSDVFKKFGLKYINAAIDDFNLLCTNPPEVITREYLQKLRQVENTKLIPFRDIGEPEFNRVLKELDQTKSDNLTYYRKVFFESEIQRYRSEVKQLVKKSVDPEKKKSLQKEFSNLRDEFIDFLDIQMGAANQLTNEINSIKTFVQKVNHTPRVAKR
ncbi:hypothetical protein [Sphingobacterium corticibacterium]|uniref:Uncharacterized protein n=1 Tax=Sphingobacterium corticibacterium TaxID=2484746 RepID=A0A4V2DBG2_9SPHI|nr:hypothetical protein [Sphingobacterium corticibacterium]RZF57878.1 hypothetical protein EWE74_19600 [Sphingobacterium corticibacterium]